jgi:hypothetical protein
MTGDTFTLVIQFVFLAAIILLLGFIGGVRVRFVGLGPKEQVTRTHASLGQVENRKSGILPMYSIVTRL